MNGGQTSREPATRRPLRHNVLRLALPLAAIGAVVALFVWRKPPAAPALEPGWPTMVSTVAGGSTAAAVDGPPWSARFAEPFGVAVSDTGAMYVADGDGAHRIRRAHPDGRVETVAGGARGFADGRGAAARFDMPSGLAVDATGTLYVADTGNHAIRRVTVDGTVSTLAGDGQPGDQDGLRARFHGPVGVAVDGAGRVLVADTYNDRIRAIAPDGTVSTLAGGSGAGFADGDGATATFDTPCGVTVDTAGNIYVADTGNGAIRRINPAGHVTTILADMEGTPLRPVAVTAGRDGAVFVADERGRILEIVPSGAARTLAGSAAGFRDGPGPVARFRRPSGIAAPAAGRVLVADTGNALLRAVTALPLAAATLPPPPSLAPRFDAEAFARTPLVWPVAPMDGPHEIAGTLGEARGGRGHERFHAGIDVRVEAGTSVRAVRHGTVTSPVSTGEFGSLNEWLRIGPVTYVHVRAGRGRGGHLTATPGFVADLDERGEVARMRIRRGTRVDPGDEIATVNAFNHVHLNVGWAGEEFNPLTLRMPYFTDRIQPTIAPRGIQLFDAAWQPFSRRGRQPHEVRGEVRIVVDAWDRADGNRAGRRLGLYALGYQILHADRTPAAGFVEPRETIEFDQLGPYPDAPRIVYAPGSGIPFYGGGRTRFLYVVTSTLRGGQAAEGFWDTRQLPDGRYIIRTHARDISGNVTAAEMPVLVRQ